jgi:hypothetical protein
MRALRVLLVALPSLLLAQPASTPRVLPTQPRWWFGGTAQFASPRGEFATQVDGAWGVAGHGLFRVAGPVLARLDLGYLNYGREVRRQPLGTGGLGLVNVDVSTTNNIVTGGIGAQLGAPGKRVSPYVGASVGYSYFYTRSSAEGQGNQNQGAFASTTNLDDAAFAPALFGGLYWPITDWIRLDIHVRRQSHDEVRYLREGSITFDSQQRPILAPVRTRADYMTFGIGVTAIAF